MRTIAIAIFFCAAPAFAAAPCQVTFDAPAGHALGGALPFGDGDFDGDGKTDLAAGTAVYLANGTQVALSVTANKSARVTDINGDGVPDIVVLTGTQLVTLINHGDATFAVHATPAVLPSSFAFGDKTVWADFNGDGLLDVFVPGLGDAVNGTPVFLARGDGTFQLDSSGALATDSSTYWIAADVDGDRRADLVSIRLASFQQPERTSIFLRTATGFAPPVAGPLGQGIPLAAADFDSDGRDDLVISSVGTRIIYDVIDATPRIASIPGNVTNAIAADLNGDGWPDLITWSSANKATVYVNTRESDRNLQASETLPMVTAPVALDADGDGRLDLAVQVPATGDAAYILRGNGDGTFRVPRAALGTATPRASGDFDGDGADDIAAPDGVAWNNGDNTFTFVAMTDPRLGAPTAAADFDGDGKAELITRTANEVLVLSPHRDGTLGEVARIEAGAFALAVGDFTGTHHPELAMIYGRTLPSETVAVYDVRTPAAPRVTLLYTGDVGPTTSGSFRGIAAADLNGDGLDDIIAATFTTVAFSAQEGALVTFLSTKNGFAAPKKTASVIQKGFNDIVAGDFDGDGKIDVFIDATFDGPHRIFYGDGTGVFRREQVFDGKRGALVAADFNGDGMTDVATSAGWIFLGTKSGIALNAKYYCPCSDPLAVRRHGAKTPWLMASAVTGEEMLLHPLCGESPHTRAVRP